MSSLISASSQDDPRGNCTDVFHPNMALVIVPLSEDDVASALTSQDSSYPPGIASPGQGPL